MKQILRVFAMAAVAASVAAGAAADVPLPVPPNQRGRIDAERSGTHDANNLRTIFWNYGMVGDYPADPINVDLSVFHSAEVPKGSGMNYSDGITPFVLAKVRLGSGLDAYIMETGYRERQTSSPLHPERIMRFEPRPGYFEPSPTLNRAQSPAISTDEDSWPDSWPDKLDDATDPGWPGSWNGYFGKRPAADQESFSVMDDDFYDAWYPDFQTDSRDATRMGLGLRVEVRGFQWSNPQAGNVIFWHYDITNEGTTDFDDNIIFGLYMDSGVGGSTISCEGVAESDDDNAYFDKSLGLNLVYTWDKGMRGRDLAGSCSPTGYLGYAYLETPGNAYDGFDNDSDGITDELRDGGPGTLISGRAAIRAYVESHYNVTQFEAFYDSIESRPAYRAGLWWTGDEDMDWVPELNDLGTDGVAETFDTGEGDGIPTAGETNFDRTDLNESDQIGLTGFQMNRIRAGAGNPDPRTDNILFYTDPQNWPQRLYEKFTDPSVPARFDSALAANYNIGFLFASGPFRLPAGKRERFSLALGYGADLAELRQTTRIVQQIYAANYQFAVPPPLPTVTAEAGDGYVRLSWGNESELGTDPVSYLNDFEGYRVYRSTEPDFQDPKVITSGRGNRLPVNGKPIAQFDLVNGVRGYSRTAVDGVQYWLGGETGITHSWTDTTVANGQTYYYAVTAYDYGSPLSVPDSVAFYPSENAIAVSRTLRGGVVLPQNAVVVRPEPRVAGWLPATAAAVAHVQGRGTGEVGVQVANSLVVPQNHLFSIAMHTPSPDSIRATSYNFVDSTLSLPLFKAGTDVDGVGAGPVGAGLLPIVRVPLLTTVDTTASGWAAGSATNVTLKVTYQPAQDPNFRRPGYPDDLTIVFDDTFVDTSTAFGTVRYRFPKPVKFTLIAHSPEGDRPLDFAFFDSDSASSTVGRGTLSRVGESIDVLTDAPYDTSRSEQTTWRVEIDGGRLPSGAIVPPRLGDVYEIRLTRPLSAGDLFTFTSDSMRVDLAAARAAWAEKPYVVPNPYMGSASFEPSRFAISGRGERRVEFRAIPTGATVRIYDVRGRLVQTLRQDGSVDGYVPWNLRTKDNLDVAPGLYIFHVDAPGLGEHIGKFAVVK
jgi:hypothetical protein